MKDLIILAAIPGFLLLILAELAIGWWRGFNTYRLNDSISSMSCGMLSQVFGVHRGGRLWGVPAYQGLWRDCLLAESWKDRLKVWVAHPGWRPAAAQRALRGYGFVQFVLAIMLTVHFLLLQGDASLTASLAYAAVLLVTMWTLSGLVENRPLFIKLELARLLLLGAGSGVAGGWFGDIPLVGAGLAVALAPLGASALWLGAIARRNTPPLAQAT